MRIAPAGLVVARAGTSQPEWGQKQKGHRNPKSCNHAAVTALRSRESPRDRTLLSPACAAGGRRAVLRKPRRTPVAVARWKPDGLGEGGALFREIAEYGVSVGAVHCVLRKLAAPVSCCSSRRPAVLIARSRLARIAARRKSPRRQARAAVAGRIGHGARAVQGVVERWRLGLVSRYY